MPPEHGITSTLTHQSVLLESSLEGSIQQISIEGLSAEQTKDLFRLFGKKRCRWDNLENVNMNCISENY